MPERMRILLVDDDASVARLVQELLRGHGFSPALHVNTGRQALESLGGVDVVLLDHQLPDTNGFEVLDAIRSRPAPPAVVMVTAHGSESLAAAALRRGADDYLAKDASLAHMLPEVLERVRRHRELRKALAAAERELVRNERLTAIGEMTVTLHHEINNPLMAALTEVELLLSDLEGPAEQRRQGLESAREALLRMRDIVQRIGRLREAPRKQYIHGIRMVDLEAGTRDEPSGERRGRALCQVADEELARVVALLLRGAGFETERCPGLPELETSARGTDVALVVIAGGGGAPGMHPLMGFAPPPRRGYPVVALVVGDPGPARDAGADHVVQLPFDPGAFVSEIVDLTSGLKAEWP